MDHRQMKWPEVLSLAGLNAAVVISWIAYHEFQPVLIDNFGMNELVGFLTLSKAIVLVLVPPLAGLLADYLLRTNGKFFTVFTIGISATAMVFMAVATIVGAGPMSAIQPYLPYMIVIWLVTMNLFVSPANSMIEAFAPREKLPIVMGVLFLTTELLYALEPVIINLVRFFGETLTFVVGGLLIGGTGFIFHRTSSHEVKLRRSQPPDDSNNSMTSLVAIIVVGLMLGLVKALLVELLPELITDSYPGAWQPETVVFLILGLSAIFGFLVSTVVVRYELERVIMVGITILIVGGVLLLVNINYTLLILGAVILALAFGLLNIAGLPFAIRNLTPRNITYGVGIYLGATEVFSGIFENLGF